MASLSGMAAWKAPSTNLDALMSKLLSCLLDEKYRASIIAQRNTGNCVDKSIILIASLRALGIPARLHLGKVKNHIAVERLIEKLGSNELTPHGMVNV